MPVFPLPLVLLPNELLPLHIFEPRYRQMLKDIELGRNMFGILFFDPEKSLDERPVAGTIGCVAEVRESKPAPDGRFNILTTGVIRCRLVDYVAAETPYYMGEVEFFEDNMPDESDDLETKAGEVYELFERIAKAAFKLSGNRGSFPDIPRSDPETFSFLVTAAFNLDNELKYKMLEIRSTAERLSKLGEILQQAVGQMEESADIFSVAQTNGHAKKNIDL